MKKRRGKTAKSKKVQLSDYFGGEWVFVGGRRWTSSNLIVYGQGEFFYLRYVDDLKPTAVVSFGLGKLTLSELR